MAFVDLDLSTAYHQLADVFRICSLIQLSKHISSRATRSGAMTSVLSNSPFRINRVFQWMQFSIISYCVLVIFLKGYGSHSSIGCIYRNEHRSLPCYMEVSKWCKWQIEGYSQFRWDLDAETYETKYYPIKDMHRDI